MGVIPRLTVILIAPVHCPKHSTFVREPTTTIAEGSVILMDKVELQPALSVMVTSYVPALKLVKFDPLHGQLGPVQL
jgi:hypothetical protein